VRPAAGPCPTIARVLGAYLAAAACVAAYAAASPACAQGPAGPAATETSRTTVTTNTADTTDPHAAQPERPTVATHAETVAPGWVEIEAGGTRSASHGVTNVQTPTVIKIGIASHLQLALATAVVAISGPGRRATGLGDAAAIVKWRLLDHAAVVGDFAVLPSIKFPTGSARDGTGTGTTDVGVLLASSHDFGALSVDVNLGATRRSGNGTTAPTTATLWTVSTSARIWRGVSWVGELYGYPGTGGPRGLAPIVAVLTGPTWTVKKWLVLDAGVSPTLRGPQPTYVYAGLTWNIGRL
jgi:hypothetical protein